MSIAELPDIQPYSLKKAEKEKLLSSYLTSLSQHHYACCEPYRKMMDGIGFDPKKDYHSIDLMFLPVQLFGMIELCSVPKEEIIRTLTSSGTSGQARSLIYLDKETAANQTKVLTKIVSSFIGTKRTPMTILDSESVIKNRNHLSANAAAITGFSLFGSTRMFALNEQMEVNTELLNSFIEKHQSERILLVGFTFKVYRFYKELIKAGIKPDLSNAVLIHGGGWKKLENESVSSKEFNNKLKDVCGIRRVHNYYGMVEQTGSIYMECEYGHLHTSVFSDVIIRRANDFSPADAGEEGIIQVLSILPKSYPGHSLLTEDRGILLGEDDCPCGRFGKYLKVTGRLEQAEIRGCSDTYDGKIN
ncbi:MAG: acyl-protein synthetase [Bacteroidetes bacterium]|nr:acyl-protein synthetase [Bacteroidota bacterium]